MQDAHTGSITQMTAEFLQEVLHLFPLRLVEGLGRARRFTPTSLLVLADRRGGRRVRARLLGVAVQMFLAGYVTVIW